MGKKRKQQISKRIANQSSDSIVSARQVPAIKLTMTIPLEDWNRACNVGLVEWNKDLENKLAIKQPTWEQLGMETLYNSMVIGLDHKEAQALEYLQETQQAKGDTSDEVSDSTGNSNQQAPRNQSPMQPDGSGS